MDLIEHVGSILLYKVWDLPYGGLLGTQMTMGKTVDRKNTNSGVLMYHIARKAELL